MDPVLVEVLTHLGAFLGGAGTLWITWRKLHLDELRTLKDWHKEKAELVQKEAEAAQQQLKATQATLGKREAEMASLKEQLSAVQESTKTMQRDPQPVGQVFLAMAHRLKRLSDDTKADVERTSSSLLSYSCTMSGMTVDTLEEWFASSKPCPDDRGEAMSWFVYNAVTVFKAATKSLSLRARLLTGFSYACLAAQKEQAVDVDAAFATFDAALALKDEKAAALLNHALQVDGIEGFVPVESFGKGILVAQKLAKSGEGAGT